MCKVSFGSEYTTSFGSDYMKPYTDEPGLVPNRKQKTKQDHAESHPKFKTQIIKQ